jgi:hypothetical protein
MNSVRNSSQKGLQKEIMDVAENLLYVMKDGEVRTLSAQNPLDQFGSS